MCDSKTYIVSRNDRCGVVRSVALVLAVGLGGLLAWLPAQAQDAGPAHSQYKFSVLSAPFPGVDQTLAYGINDFGMSGENSRR